MNRCFVKNGEHGIFLNIYCALSCFWFPVSNLQRWLLAWYPNRNQEGVQPIAIPLGLSHHLRLKSIVPHSSSLLSFSFIPPRSFLFHCDSLQTIDLLYTRDPTATMLGWEASRLPVPSFPSSSILISLGYSQTFLCCPSEPFLANLPPCSTQPALLIQNYSVLPCWASQPLLPVHLCFFGT